MTNLEFSDNFNDNELSTRWESGTNGGASVEETGRKIKVTLPSGVSEAYAYIRSGLSYDISDKQVFCKISPADVANAQSILRINSGTDFYQIHEDGGVLYAYLWDGSSHILDSVTTTDQWIRIKYDTSDGKVYFQHSSDGKSWTTFYSETSQITLTSVTVELRGYASASLGAEKYVYFDNFCTFIDPVSDSSGELKPKFYLGLSWHKNKNIATVDDSYVDDPTECVKPVYGWRIGVDPLGSAYTDRVIGGERQSAYETGAYFRYTDESGHVLKLATLRETIEPLNGIQRNSMAVVLQNTDDRYTYSSDPDIGNYIQQGKPVSLKLGFLSDAVTEVVEQMYGIISSPKTDMNTRTMEFSGVDALSFMADQEIKQNTIYENENSADVIADLLSQFDIVRRDFDAGLNTIEFTILKKGKNLLNAIREICEAEGAVLFQREDGVVCFRNRNNVKTDTAYSFASNVKSWTRDSTAQIINICKVKANPRHVVGEQPVFTIDSAIELAIGENEPIWLELQNPVTTLNALVSGTDWYANTESDGSGTDVTSNVRISYTLFADTILLKITNNTNQVVYIPSLEFTGTPAIPIFNEPITAEYRDEESIEEFGEQPYTIENDYIDDQDFADYLAEAIVTKFTARAGRDQNDRIIVKVHARPLLQIGDRVQLTDPITSVVDYYRVLRIYTEFSPSTGLIQTLNCRRIRSGETMEVA